MQQMARLALLHRVGHRLGCSLESNLRVGTIAERLLRGRTAATEHGPGLGLYDIPVGVTQFDSAGDYIRSVWPCSIVTSVMSNAPSAEISLIDDYRQRRNTRNHLTFASFQRFRDEDRACVRLGTTTIANVVRH